MSRRTLAAAGLCLWFPSVAGCAGEPFSGAAPNEAGAGVAGLAAGRASGGATGQGGKALPVGKGGAATGGTEPTLEAGAGGMNDAAGGAAAPLGCPKLPGQTLVLVDGFCIDESEVTAAHYQQFLATQPSLVEQTYECLGNLTFENGCEYSEPAKQPVRCVDFCDARAYCVSVGKRLCGAASVDAAAMPYDAPAAALDNQWYAACSHGGEFTYPYGNEYSNSACWGAEHPPLSTMLVKSAPACVGGYAGLWDVSGGMAEWIDSCNGAKGPADACRIRGGSQGGTAEELRCDWQSATARDTVSHYIGFRCCADAE